MHREAGRPLPRLAGDDVLDFVIMEAIELKVGVEAQKAQEAQERAQFRGSHKGLTVDALKKAAANG